MIKSKRNRIPILKRGCDSCRHDRTNYFYGDFFTPPDVEVGCAVINDDEPAPHAASLMRFVKSGTYDYILEHGGCPSWQPWTPCGRHGLPSPPNGDCEQCNEEIARDEMVNR